MSARSNVRIAWALFAGSLIGWAITAFTIARDEPQVILGISWLAITLTAWDIIRTSNVEAKQEDGDES